MDCSWTGRRRAVGGSRARAAAPPRPPQAPGRARRRACFPTTPAWCSTSSRPDKTADFEMVDGQAEGSADEEREAGAQAAGGELEGVQVARSGAGGNVLYVFVIDPAVKGADYTVSNILAEAFPSRRPTRSTRRTPTRTRRAEHRQPVVSMRQRSRRSSAGPEFQIQSRVDAVRWRVQRTASQLEHPVVHAQPQRSDQRNLHAAAGVEARSPCPCARRASRGTSPPPVVKYGWKPKMANGRLQQHVAHAGLERRRAAPIVVVRCRRTRTRSRRSAGRRRRRSPRPAGWPASCSRR